MIPNDMTPPPVITEETRQSEIEEAYQRGLNEGRSTAIFHMLQAMKCESERHSSECGCDGEYNRMKKRLAG